MFTSELFNQDAMLISALKASLTKLLYFQGMKIKENSTYLSFMFEIRIGDRGFHYDSIKGMDVYTIHQADNKLRFYGKIKEENYYDLTMLLMKIHLERKAQLAEYSFVD